MPSHYLNQWCPNLLIHICVTWPQWVNPWLSPFFYSHILEKGLSEFSLLGDSDVYDSTLCVTVADVDLDGQNEILLGTYGQVWEWGLTHWGRVTHICIGKLTIIGSDNGLLPSRRQAITWTNAGIFKSTRVTGGLIVFVPFPPPLLPSPPPPFCQHFSAFREKPVKLISSNHTCRVDLWVW